MAKFRVSFFFTTAGQGWSETWYTADKTDGQLGLDLEAIIAARQSFLFDIEQWAGVRVANLTARRQSRLFLPGVNGQSFGGKPINVPVNGAIGTSTSQVVPLTLNAALKYTMNLPDGRKITRYQSPVPKATVRQGDGAFAEGDPANWWTGWRSYTGEISARGWGVRARRINPDSLDLPVQLLRQQAPPSGILEVVVNGNSPLTLDSRSMVHVHGTKRKKTTPGATLNGKYIVQSITTITGPPQQTAYGLRGTEGVDPADFKLLGSVQGVSYDVFGVSDAVPMQIISHKRGRPTLARRGRRLTHLSLDP